MSAICVGQSRLRPTRWCVLISGRGSNLAAVLEMPEAEVRLVISSTVTAGGVSKSVRAGVPTLDFPRDELGKLDWESLDELLKQRSIDAIFLLGFMRIVPADFIAKWLGRILNLHPSLLPKYPGLKSIERAIDARDDLGVTIHQVVATVDTGPILKSRRTLVAGEVSGESSKIKLLKIAAETLVHVDEHRLVKEMVSQWRM